MEIKAVVNSAKAAVANHLPSIATGTGCVLLGWTILESFKAAPKLKEALEKERIMNGELKFIDKVKIGAPIVWRVVLTSTGSVVCFIAANRINAKMYASAVAAYQISDTALKEFKEQAIKTLGEKKTREVEDKVAIEKVRINPIDINAVECTGHGNQLCFDAAGNRPFRCSSEWIRRAQEKIKLRMVSGQDEVSVNELYNEIGLSPTDFGDLLGWNIESFSGINMENVNLVRFTYTEADNGEQMTVISFPEDQLSPTWWYRDR